MKRYNSSSGENWRVVLFTWTFLSVACMVVMLGFASRKTIVIEDVSRNNVAENTDQNPVTTRQQKLLINKTYGVEKCFYISLPREMKAENVVMENRYQDRKLCLYIKGATSESMEAYEVTGDISTILEGSCEEQQDGLLLELTMNRILEYKSTMEGNMLTIAWLEPWELNDLIAVIDPVLAGESQVTPEADREDITLQIAKRLLKSASIPGVKLYLTRTENKEASNEMKAELVEELQADLYIGISVMEDSSKPDTYGILGKYNDAYYLPYFGNPDLADLLTREVTIASSNRALGLMKAEEDSFLRQLSIPAAEISVGYVSNPQEQYLLHQEEYQEKLASGILKALTEGEERLRQSDYGQIEE